MALFFETIHIASLAHFLWTLAATSLKLILIPMQFLAEFGPSGLWVRPTLCVLLFFGILPWFLKFKTPKWKKYLCPSITLVCGAFILVQLFSKKPSAQILDVNQGDAILLQNIRSFPNSKPFLVDVGPPGLHAYPGPIARSIAKTEIDSLDGILLTHPDLDHIGALPDIILRYPIESKSAWIHPQIFNELKFFPYLVWLERADIKLNFIYTNTKPYENLICATTDHIKNANNLSPLCSFTLESEKKLLLTGDMDKKAESYYLQNTPHLIKTDYIKLAHHGSHSSSSYEFLLASEAKTALVSAGKNNRYHHPHSDIIERIKSFNMKVLQTSINGTIKIN